MSDFRLYTDGSSHARGEKPGGWGWILTKWTGDGIREPRQLRPIHAGYGGHPRTTNNRMELSAIMQGLGRLASGCCERRCLSGGDVRIEVVSDSQYALGIASGRYVPTKNKDLADAIQAELRRFRLAGVEVTFSWIRGHSGEAWNERVDGLAKKGKDEAESEIPFG